MLPEALLSHLEVALDEGSGSEQGVRVQGEDDLGIGEGGAVQKLRIRCIRVSPLMEPLKRMSRPPSDLTTEHSSVSVSTERAHPRARPADINPNLTALGTHCESAITRRWSPGPWGPRACASPGVEAPRPAHVLNPASSFHGSDAPLYIDSQRQRLARRSLPHALQDTTHNAIESHTQSQSKPPQNAHTLQP